MKDIATCALLFFCACGPKPSESGPPAATPAGAGYGDVLTQKLAPDMLPEDMYLHVQVSGFGLIVVKLFPADAPGNVTNVANLAIEGFYDGLTFHRIIEGFVIQGGDPDATGAGGLGYTVPAEIARLHDKGCMAMARKSDDVNPQKENSSCQFYFCLEDIHKLDGNYTVIGQIVSGLEVMEAIGQVDTDEKDMPLDAVVMQKVWVTAL